MKIIIPGIPIPQARMRHSSFGGFVKTYDPKAKEKSLIRLYLSQFEYPEFNHPQISFLFHMPIPSGVAKKSRDIYESGLLKHEKKPDVDNLVKLYLDCLDGIVIHGDQKVSLGSCIKVYHKDPKTVVVINETSQILKPEELDFHCLNALALDTLCFYEQDCLSYYESLSLRVRALFPRNCGPLDEVEPLKRLVEPQWAQGLPDTVY